MTLIVTHISLKPLFSHLGTPISARSVQEAAKLEDLAFLSGTKTRVELGILGQGKPWQ
jgi:hypothetical protein